MAIVARDLGGKPRQLPYGPSTLEYGKPAADAAAAQQATVFHFTTKQQPWRKPSKWNRPGIKHSLDAPCDR